MIKNYGEFLDRVNELGFYAFSGKFADGFPKLDNETIETQWHTGDPNTDPWQWRIRSVEEKKLAFGSILGGYKGFISKEYYRLFYAVNHPEKDMMQMYDTGELSAVTLKIYKLFEKGTVLSTADIRSLLNVSKKEGASKTDKAVEELERMFFLSICGSKRKISIKGKEYGWAANAYCLTDDWAGKEWICPDSKIDPKTARDIIIERACTFSDKINRDKLSKMLFG